MLAGIGLMLMGACGFVLSVDMDWASLVPALAGIVMGVASAAALHQEVCRKPLIYINGAASVPVMIQVFCRILPDFIRSRSGSMMILADLEMLALASIFLLWWALEDGRKRKLAAAPKPGRTQASRC